MENPKLIFLFISLLSIIPWPSQSSSNSTCLETVNEIRFTFYTHDRSLGDGQNVYSVARSIITDQVPSAFGVVYVVDVLATYGPEITSKKLGRIQGATVSSDLREVALDVIVNLVITEGEWKGSTLNIFGRNPLEDEVREVSIVGGTSAFKLAWGYATTSTYYVNKYRTDYVFKYDVVVYNTTFAP
ncbi:dirigent protein 11-like [Andrographis paniculata]|uniref:dirigent protein 11-like n=1 Tax=Andrographis paniculata TaxID=175694 RepID=UPI0021E98841|nr:dirigent protein 11-like [Andrographis paniculata]